MKFFGRGKDVATEVAVGPPSEASDNAAEKQSPPVVDADALERVPSQNVQVGLSMPICRDQGANLYFGTVYE